MSGLTLPMEVGEWVLVRYQWEQSDAGRAVATYEQKLETLEAVAVIRELPAVMPSRIIELLAGAGAT